MLRTDHRLLLCLAIVHSAISLPLASDIASTTPALSLTQPVTQHGRLNSEDVSSEGREKMRNPWDYSKLRAPYRRLISALNTSEVLAMEENQDLGEPTKNHDEVGEIINGKDMSMSENKDSNARQLEISHEMMPFQGECCDTSSNQSEIKALLHKAAHEKVILEKSDKWYKEVVSAVMNPSLSPQNISPAAEKISAIPKVRYMDQGEVDERQEPSLKDLKSDFSTKENGIGHKNDVSSVIVENDCHIHGKDTKKVMCSRHGSKESHQSRQVGGASWLRNRIVTQADSRARNDYNSLVESGIKDRENETHRHVGETHVDHGSGEKIGHFPKRHLHFESSAKGRHTNKRERNDLSISRSNVDGDVHSVPSRMKLPASFSGGQVGSARRGRAIGQGRGRPLAPRFMLELYQRFATDRSMMPSANTVRSFNNQDLTGWLCGWDKWPVWIAPMLFNFSIPQNERVILAELRIAPCIRRGKRNESWSLESDGDFEKEQEEFGGNEEGDGTDKNQEHIKSKEDTTWRHQEKILENGVSEMFRTRNRWEFQGKEEGEKKKRGQHEVQKEEDWKILKVSEILDKEQENNKQTNRRERTSISGDVEIQEKHKEEDEKESGKYHKAGKRLLQRAMGMDKEVVTMERVINEERKQGETVYEHEVKSDRCSSWESSSDGQLEVSVIEGNWEKQGDEKEEKGGDRAQRAVSSHLMNWREEQEGLTIDMTTVVRGWMQESVLRHELSAAQAHHLTITMKTKSIPDAEKNLKPTSSWKLGPQAHALLVVFSDTQARSTSLDYHDDLLVMMSRETTAVHVPSEASNHPSSSRLSSTLPAHSPFSGVSHQILSDFPPTADVPHLDVLSRSLAPKFLHQQKTFQGTSTPQTVTSLPSTSVSAHPFSPGHLTYHHRLLPHRRSTKSSIFIPPHAHVSHSPSFPPFSNHTSCISHQLSLMHSFAFQTSISSPIPPFHLRATSQPPRHHRGYRSTRNTASTSGVCHRSPLYVNFKQIGWDEWIIAPHGYQAYQCVGLCSFPLGNQQPPTKHALIRASLRHRRPHALHSLHRPGRPCCVPTRLNPISILYLDSKGVVTYKYKYEGMSVAECGCR